MPALRRSSGGARHSAAFSGAPPGREHQRGAERFRSRRQRLGDTVALCAGGTAISAVATLVLLPDLPLRALLPTDAVLGLVGTVLVLARWATSEADDRTPVARLLPAAAGAVLLATAVGWTPILCAVLLASG